MQRFLRGRFPFASSHWPCDISAKFKLVVWKRVKKSEDDKPLLIRDMGEEDESIGAILRRLGKSTEQCEPPEETL